MAEYGYVRVSTKYHNAEAQLADLETVNLPKDQIYIDELSGKDSNWPQYRKLIKKLKEGDKLYIKSIGRLGYDYSELREQWMLLTEEKKVDIIVLDFPLSDTMKQVDRISNKFVSDLILQVLTYLMREEKESNLEHQLAGMQEAREKGVQFGRPKVEYPEDYTEVLDQCQRKEISLREGARRLNTNHATLSRWLRDRAAALE